MILTVSVCADRTPSLPAKNRTNLNSFKHYAHILEPRHPLNMPYEYIFPIAMHIRTINMRRQICKHMNTCTMYIVHVTHRNGRTRTHSVLNEHLTSYFLFSFFFCFSLIFVILSLIRDTRILFVPPASQWLEVPITNWSVTWNLIFCFLSPPLMCVSFLSHSHQRIVRSGMKQTTTTDKILRRLLIFLFFTLYNMPVFMWICPPPLLMGQQQKQHRKQTNRMEKIRRHESIASSTSSDGRLWLILTQQHIRVVHTPSLAARYTCAR